MNKSIFTNWKDIVIGAIGILGLGYGIAMHTKLAKVSDRLDKSIEELSGNMNINISDEIVDKAVDKAVNAEAKKVVEQATKEALDELKRDIKTNVSIAVDKEYETIKDTVLEKVTDAAAKIDVAKVRSDVEKAAKTAALDKFNDNLEDILAKFNDNLNNTSKIYNSIASSMTRGVDAGKEFVFKVN